MSNMTYIKGFYLEDRGLGPKANFPGGLSVAAVTPGKKQGETEKEILANDQGALSRPMTLST